MVDCPEPLVRIDRYFAAAVIAHEVIFDLHAELVAQGRADARTRALLHESAHLATVEMAEAATEARRLAAVWIEQQLLDPTSAADTLRLLEAEVRRVEPELVRRRARQNEIVTELRRLTDEPSA